MGLGFGVLVSAAGLASMLGVSAASAFLSKLYLFIYGVINMITENSRGASKKAIASFKSSFTHSVPEGTTKTVYFVRHGESEWNYMVNRGPIGFLYMPWYFVLELLTIFTADSYFYDSPLSTLGKIQGKKIMKEVFKKCDTEELQKLKAVATSGKGE